MEPTCEIMDTNGQRAYGVKEEEADKEFIVGTLLSLNLHYTPPYTTLYTYAVKTENTLTPQIAILRCPDNICRHA